MLLPSRHFSGTNCGLLNFCFYSEDGVNMATATKKSLKTHWTTNVVQTKVSSKNSLSFGRKTHPLLQLFLGNKKKYTKISWWWEILWLIHGLFEHTPSTVKVREIPDSIWKAGYFHFFPFSFGKTCMRSKTKPKTRNYGAPILLSQNISFICEIMHLLSVPVDSNSDVS